MDNNKKTSKWVKKMMVICLIGFVLALVMLPYILMIPNPMRRPQAAATNYVLGLTPIGTHIDDVISIVENHRDWTIERIDRERGFSHPRPHLIPGWPNDMVLPPGWILSESRTRSVIVGEQSIRVQAGRHWPFNAPLPFGLLMETIVSVFWGFDEDGKLIEVYVWMTSR